MEFYGTIGPACASADCLRRMTEAGMTGIRLNLSHGTLDSQRDKTALIHQAGISQLLIDLQGPELRIGRLTEPLLLREGERVSLGEDGVPCPDAVLRAVSAGQRLLLDDGRLELSVETAELDRAVCLIREHTAAIDAMVDALLEKNHLKEKEIDDIFTRTVTAPETH